jgi:Fe-S cluster assembly ATP-binding protein
MLNINELKASIEEKEILKGLNLKVGKGQIHAIMGPNGAGKSTLAKILAGHPSYDVDGGSVEFEGKEILDLEPDARSHLGLFMSFQYPVEVPGVSNKMFLKTALNTGKKARGEETLTDSQFEELIVQKMNEMEMKPEFKERSLNEGFSGGEKKRNEILQMAVLNPKLAILDETDSGLDIDAMRIVAKGVNQFMSEDKSLILITHYQRLLDYIKPDYVHVMVDGRIVATGGPELALKLEEKGYDWLTNPEMVGGC